MLWWRGRIRGQPISKVPELERSRPIGNIDEREHLICDGVPFRIGEADDQLPGRQVWLVERQLHDFVPDHVREAVSNPSKLRAPVFKGCTPARVITVVPAVEGLTGNAEVF